ncbi:MAG: hypothetical protein KJ717_11900, partial [Proteobacteria bacterium]|nr:hypothetical protein [Pseudomonadota bacterium]
MKVIEEHSLTTSSKRKPVLHSSAGGQNTNPLPADSPSLPGKILAHRLGGVLLFGLAFIFIAFLTRFALLCKSYPLIDHGSLTLLKIFLWGFVYDLAAASYFIIPLTFYLILLPEK